VVDIDHFQELHLFELVRDVTNHYSSALFLISHDLEEVDVILNLPPRAFLFFFGAFSLELRLFRLFLRGVTLSSEGLRVRLVGSFKSFLGELANVLLA
jgi:hypothetical protein